MFCLEKTKKYILFDLIIIFSFIFPFSIIKHEFYIVSILALFFIIYVNMKYKNQMEIKYKILKGIIIIYSIYINIITLYIKPEAIMLSLNKSITLILFMSLIKYCYYENIIKRFDKYFLKNIIFVMLIFILLYLIGIDGVNMQLSNLSLIRDFNSYNFFNERRLTGTYEHKIQFAGVALIGVFFVLNKSKSKKIKKIIFMAIFLMAILYSNSKISIIVMIILFLLSKIGSLNKEFKKVKKVNQILPVCIKLYALIVVIFVTFLLTPIIIKNIGQERNLDTLGSRTIIWELTIDEIKNNPMGIIKSYGHKFYGTNFSTAHNIFLNEFLETGIIGGILYIGILFMAFFMIKSYQNKLFMLIILAMASMDSLISGIFAYIFWISLAVLIADERHSCNNKKILFIRR